MPLIRPRVQGSDRPPDGSILNAILDWIPFTAFMKEVVPSQRVGKPPVDERISASVVGEEGDGSTLKAILGWIPTEVITAYKAGIGFVPLTYPSWRLWITILGIPITFLWIAYATRKKDEPLAWRQALISPVAFAFWVAAIEPDVMKMLNPDWQIWMGSLFLAGGMLLLPILDGILRSLGVKQN
jgi:hypothetical protein